MVVDDDPGIRQLTANALAYCVNREILSFCDADTAWNYLDDGGKADIVISDVDMPGMTGFELLKKFKAKFTDKIFILMSGKTGNADRAEHSGADAFLGKPFAITDLFSIVQNYVVD